MVPVCCPWENSGIFISVATGGFWVNQHSMRRTNVGVDVVEASLRGERLECSTRICLVLPRKGVRD